VSAARDAVDAIIEDLSDRRGLADEWQSVSPDIREEIRVRWIEIIEKLSPAGNALPEDREILRRMAVLSDAIEKSRPRSGKIFFDYMNHRGVSERRCVVVARLRLQPEGEAFHAGQWVLHGVCLSRGEIRDFLIDHIENVEAGK
jgi:hypothetical protein